MANRSKTEIDKMVLESNADTVWQQLLDSEDFEGMDYIESKYFDNEI